MRTIYPIYRFTAALAVALVAVALVGCPVATTPSVPTGAPFAESVPLSDLVARTLRDNQQQRGLSADVHGAWQILHGVLAYGQSFEAETSVGRRPVVRHLIDGGRIAGFDPTAGDPFGDPPRPGLRVELQPEAKIGQGHRDQWLAVMVQTGLSEEAEIRSGESTFTMRDWVNQVQYDVPLNLEREFSWTLIGLTAYDSTDASWTARDGHVYSTELLLESELNQELESSACGGTHRLIGIAMAVNKRRAEGAAMTGVWTQAEQQINASIQEAKQNQNADGSYSVAYMHRPGWTRDLSEGLGTTGHVLEFLAIAAPDDVLRQPWVERTARRLCGILDQCAGVDLECGALYHALHALAEYQERTKSSGS